MYFVHEFRAISSINESWIDIVLLHGIKYYSDQINYKRGYSCFYCKKSPTSLTNINRRTLHDVSYNDEL